MNPLCRARLAALSGLVVCAVFVAPGPAAAGPAAPEPRSFRVQVVGHGQPMILIPGLSSSGDT